MESASDEAAAQPIPEAQADFVFEIKQKFSTFYFCGYASFYGCNNFTVVIENFLKFQYPKT